MNWIFKYVRNMKLQLHISSLIKLSFWVYYTMRTNLPKTLDQLKFGNYTLTLSKFTKYLVNVLKFTKYLVNSYHQKDVKHYVLTN